LLLLGVCWAALAAEAIGLAQFRRAHEVPGHHVRPRMKGKEGWPVDWFFGMIWRVTDGISRWLGRTINKTRRCGSGLWRLEARLKGVQFQGDVAFWGRPLISVAPHSELVLGSNVQLASALRSNLLGCLQPCVLRTLAPEARLVLAANCGASGAVICAGISIEVGEGTLIGSGAMILDNDFHVLTANGWRNEVRANARAIKIGREVFIGARAIILKGVSIGDRAVIGAGAVVTHDVPANCVAVGNPASVRTEHLAADGMG